MFEGQDAFEKGAGISMSNLTLGIASLLSLVILIWTAWMVKKLFMAFHSKKIKAWQFLMYLGRLALLSTIFLACIIKFV